jgi:hypothetical protein
VYSIQQPEVLEEVFKGKEIAFAKVFAVARRVDIKSKEAEQARKSTQQNTLALTSSNLSSKREP